MIIDVKVKCPYCGYTNEYRVSQKKKKNNPYYEWHKKPGYNVCTCDCDEGAGCGRLFVANITVVATAKAYVINDEQSKPTNSNE